MAERKKIIASAFSSGSASYDKAAQLQQDVAPLVAKLATGRALPANPKILEIGCGTGGLTRHLLGGIKDGSFLITDISDGMIDQCRQNITDKRVTFKSMDGEHPDLGDATFDLIVSSLTVQWFLDLKAGLKELINHLAPGGYLVFSTLGQLTFDEWRKAHHAIGLRSGIPHFPPKDDLAALFPDAGELVIDRQLITRTFPDAHSFARMLKAIGANTPVAGHRPLTPRQFRQLTQTLGRDFDVTYDVLFATYKADEG